MLDDQIRFNRRRTVVIVATMLLILFLVVVAVGFLMGVGLLGSILLGTVVALLYFAIASGSSVQAILAATKARPANPHVRNEKLLLFKVEELAIASGIPKPKVYVQDSGDINAFAAGRRPEEAVVAVTTGALEQLNQEELEGVLAHELAHIKNYDVRLATYTIAIVGIIALFAEIVFYVILFGGVRGGGRRGGPQGPAVALMILVAILVVILAPLLSRLVYMAMSRRREYLADASGAYMTRNPEGLASALEKILNSQPKHPKGSKTVAALYMANPWKRTLRESLWNTHPPLPERIRRLRGPSWRPEAAGGPTGAPPL